ncbi:MAG: Flp family type IVb pilin [Planctomycetota bacterium]|jgi:Flp pilus assembly pilin Flp
MKALSRFFKDESGGEMPEYAVVVGIIIVVGAAVFVYIGGHINDIFTALNAMLGNAAP